MPISQELLDSIRNNQFTKRELDLSGKELEDEDVRSLASALSQNEHIKAVNLSENPIKDAGVQAVITLANIEELDVSETFFTASTTEFANIPFQDLSLRKLNVSQNRIGDRGALLISKIQNLVELGIEGCEVTNVGISALIRPTSPLEKLKIGYNMFDHDALKNIKNNATLTQLSLPNICVPGKEINFIKVLNFILENETLETLDLSSNLIKNEVKIIAEHRSIKILNLAHNYITGEGLAAFSNNMKLEELLLFDNEIDSDGVNQFAKHNLTRIFCLNLCSNELDDNCIQALASLRSLRKVDLSRNSITEAGGKVLLDLCGSSNLQEVDLSSNLVPKSMLIEFVRHTKKNRQDQALGNDIEASPTKKSKARLVRYPGSLES